MIRTGSEAISLYRTMLVMAGAGVVLAMLGACSSAPPLFMPDGRPTTQVQCRAADLDSCAAQARAQCGNAGFDDSNDSEQDGVHTMVFACRQQGDAQQY